MILYIYIHFCIKKCSSFSIMIRKRHLMLIRFSSNCMSLIDNHHLSYKLIVKEVSNRSLALRDKAQKKAIYIPSFYIIIMID
jgi:hypothetical protein